jgi:hypothetical protein
VIPVLVAIVRILMVLFVVRLALRLWGELRRGTARGAARGAPRAAAQDLVRDRVCNTFIPRSRALVVRTPTSEEYYCSPACREKATA